MVLSNDIGGGINIIPYTDSSVFKIEIDTLLSFPTILNNKQTSNSNKYSNNKQPYLKSEEHQEDIPKSKSLEFLA